MLPDLSLSSSTTFVSTAAPARASLFYRGLRVWARAGAWVSFRAVYVSGRVPPAGPLVLASNHPNSFLDAILIAVVTRRRLHFLARGDAFHTPFKRFLLGKIGLIPIFRAEEGAENLARNADTFAHCQRILAAGGAILIFAEGICVQEKRLRPPRKGLGRLVLGTEHLHQYQLGVQVVPVSLNYTAPTTFRSRVMIHFAPPLAMSALRQTHRQHPALALRQLNARLTAAWQQCTVVIPDPAQEALAELALTMARQPTLAQRGWLRATGTWPSLPLQTEQRVASHVAHCFAQGGAQPLCASAAAYCAVLMHHQLRDADVAVRAVPRVRWWRGVGLVAYGLHRPPAWLAHRLAQHWVRQPVFFASVRFGLGLACFPLYALGWLGIGAALGGTGGAGLAAILWVSTGQMALRHADGRAPGRWQLPQLSAATWTALCQQRAALLAQLMPSPD